MFIATLIAADRLSPGDISLAADRLRDAGLEPGAPSWVEAGEACDLSFDGAAPAARAALEGLLPGTDVIVQAAEGRAKRLLVSDMDSTMITVECIDELADYAGLKDRVSEITERAMRGELDFEAALDARVGLLADLDAEVIDRCHSERVKIMPGAEALVRTMKREGATCILVSGGFTLFADRVAEAIGFDTAISNVLGIGGGRLDGTVARPIVGAAKKREVLLAAATEGGIALQATLAVGDGANDIPMIEVAGLGVAYHAKPATAAAAGARIDHCDLTALLFAQGYARSRWAV
jgi:phosphoserine phosphatase